ncbi:hypothetical protein [Paenibacillus ehimensis]|uniref:Transposase n=1 Tax=Paenibacillus ehimensis TaxID=79264 RepID=A0ABT8V887_9BACL|nr:hypothetical protein [Paenibacillus ehimensis]MDO3676669.1 hypothetical protein [Paenibacillus ehimensis]
MLSTMVAPELLEQAGLGTLADAAISRRIEDLDGEVSNDKQPKGRISIKKGRAWGSSLACLL